MDAPELDLTTAIKLASLVVHVQEAGAPGGHELDWEAARGLADDPAVTEWIAGFDRALLPVKRRGGR